MKGMYICTAFLFNRELIKFIESIEIDSVFDDLSSFIELAKPFRDNLLYQFKLLNII